MKIKNTLKHGSLLDIYTNNNAIYLTNGNYTLDISNLLTKEESSAIFLLKKALGIVVDEDTINPILAVNYHTHSEYSILDGMSKIKDIAKKSSGVSALTEHGNMYSMLKWQREMKKAGKHPIFGCEVYAENINGEKTANHLVLLAKNEIGKQNLFTIVSDAYSNFYRKPHVTYQSLMQHKEGLICTSACIGGEISRYLSKKDYESAKKVALWLKNLFQEDFYLEIQRHNIAEESIVNPLLLKLSQELDIKVIAANDSHYINKEDEKAHEMLLCINTGKKMSDPDHFKFDGDGYYFLSDLEMVERFKDIPYVVANTLELAKKCNLEIETGVYHFPKFDIPKEYPNEELYLDFLITEGFRKRFEGTEKFNSEEYQKRLIYEKQVIMSMGFAGYFLIVWDYIHYAKTNDIYVGAGRGSAVGSLVCYCLEITDLDPIEYGLLFERFLNPERISMPDIDVDFEFERREEIIQYVRQKYGEDCVSRIITFGNIKTRMALKDSARVLLGDYKIGDEICKTLPKGVDISLEDALDIPEFHSIIENNNTVYHSARKIENLKRQTGVHACGVIIADAPVKNYMPTAIVKDKEKKQITVTQIEEVEDMGLLKMDFLGLKNMSVISNTFRNMNNRRIKNHIEPIKNWRDIPLNDPYPYIPISKGNCHAIFQIEGEGMRKFMKELFSDVSFRIKQIENKYKMKGFEFIEGDGNVLEYKEEMQELGIELFNRMIAGVSLYRPGPMDYIPDYIKGMLNPKEIQYDVELLREILKDTYGVIVYQEQVMQIVRKLAGFSMPQADYIRKAMGKKKQEILDEYKPYFIYGSGHNVDDKGNPLNIKGCIANNISEDIASVIWDKMKDFAKYAFNKSHAAGYSVITITCAWLKYYYSDLYMTSQLNAYISDSAKLKGYLSIAKNLGIEILKPSINKSDNLFITEGYNQIRFGLSGIKGLNNVNDILTNRAVENFCDFTSTVNRLHTIGYSNKKIKTLIMSGAFDDFMLNRKTMCENTELLIGINKETLTKRSKQERFLFAIDDAFEVQTVNIKNFDEYEEKERLEYEKEMLGFYLTGNPLDCYSEILEKENCSKISLFNFEEESSCTFAGIINSVKQLRTKNGNKAMANIVIEDQTGEASIVIFNKTYENCFDSLEEGEIVVIKGKTNIDSIYGTQVIAESVIPIRTLMLSYIKSVLLKIDNQDIFTEVIDIISRYKGNVPIYSFYNNNWNLLGNVCACSSLILRLQTLLGKENVAFQ